MEDVQKHMNESEPKRKSEQMVFQKRAESLLTGEGEEAVASS